jgi:apolipoprotein N-acyltransferase
MSRRARLLLAGAYAVTTFLAFPQPLPRALGGGVLDLGIALGWLAPACLVLLLRGLSPRRAAAWGFGASLLAHTALIHWIYVVTVVYGNAPVVVGLVAPALLACYCASFAGLFGAGWSWLARRGLATPWSAALLWTALDLLRSWEFPWGTLGYVQHLNRALLPLAAYGGVYALSFVTALGGAALAMGLVAEDRARHRRGIALAVAAVLVAHVAGIALRPPPLDDASAVEVAVLQGNIDQGVKWSRSFAERTLEIYEEQTREVVAAGAELVVWPETAVPGAIEADPALRQRLAGLARETGAWLVVGGVGVDYDGGPRPSAYFDSAFSFSPAGALTDRYDKTKLVPFGEYVPLRWLLGLFVRTVASGATSLDVSTGERPRRMELLDGSLGAGVVICYELLFPDLVRRFAADGAEMLLAITNDAWYGRTGAPHQFLAMTALRSAETGLWTARAANTGVSAFIDARGRVLEETPVFERAWLAARVPRRPQPQRATFYVRHGDLFAWLCWLGVIALAAWGRVLGPERVREANE